MYSRRFPLTCLCVLISSASFVFAGAPRLVLRERVKDFGAVDEGKVLTCTVDLSNGGDAVLTIQDVSPSCGCTTTGEWPHTLKPGEHASIPIHVDTTHFLGPIGKTVTITTDDPTHPQTFFEIRATVTTAVSIAAPTLVFPAASDPSRSYARSTTIRAEVPEPLHLSTPVSDNPLFRPELKTIIANKEYDLVVTTGTPLPEGTHSARITMTSSVKKAPQIVVQAVITLLPPVQVAPSQIPLVQHKLEHAEKRYAVVMSRRQNDLQVSELTTDAPGVTLSVTDAPSHRQATILVSFPVGFEIKTGQRYAIRAKTNLKALPNVEIPIVYSGRP